MIAVDTNIDGPLVDDARVAAMCTRHGVRELRTADRDFSRFPGVKAVNPLFDCSVPTYLLQGGTTRLLRA